MARRDLTNAEIEEMGRVNPGSAAEYLRLMREELAEEKQARREEEDGERFPNGELYEVGEDNLTFFEGDAFCGDCALHHGVL